MIGDGRGKQQYQRKYGEVYSAATCSPIIEARNKN